MSAVAPAGQPAAQPAPQSAAQPPPAQRARAPTSLSIPLFVVGLGLLLVCICNTEYSFFFQNFAPGPMSSLLSLKAPPLRAKVMDKALQDKMKCDFEFLKVDPACPRFVDVRFNGPAGSGLGDRFLQMLIGLTYAIHLDAMLINTDDVLGMDSVHGNDTYAWIPDFFKFNYANAAYTRERVLDDYPNLNIIEHPELHGTSFKDRVAKLKQECNTIIYVDWADCIDNSCYYAYDPKIYEHTHNMLSCWFTHTDRSALPPLVYDHAWYNVAIHIRTGDITLLSNEKGGVAFFEGLEKELDIVLKNFPVHYYFFANSPKGNMSLPDSYEEPTSMRAYDEPARNFTFLKEIFSPRDGTELLEEVKLEGEEGKASEKSKKSSSSSLKQQQEPPRRKQPRRVSYVNDMNVKSTLYHQMNADMVVTTGSSFAFVAPTVSTKPIVLFSRTKEGDHFPVYLRPDYALVERDGRIIKPTISELQAQVAMRYAEVHEKVVPYRER